MATPRMVRTCTSGGGTMHLDDTVSMIAAPMVAPPMRLEVGRGVGVLVVIVTIVMTANAALVVKVGLRAVV